MSKELNLPDGWYCAKSDKPDGSFPLVVSGEISALSPHYHWIYVHNGNCRAHVQINSFYPDPDKTFPPNLSVLKEHPDYMEGAIQRAEAALGVKFVELLRKLEPATENGSLGCGPLIFLAIAAAGVAGAKKISEKMQQQRQEQREQKC